MRCTVCVCVHACDLFRPRQQHHHHRRRLPPTAANGRARQAFARANQSQIHFATRCKKISEKQAKRKNVPNKNNKDAATVKNERAASRKEVSKKTEQVSRVEMRLGVSRGKLMRTLFYFYSLFHFVFFAIFLSFLPQKMSIRGYALLLAHRRMSVVYLRPLPMLLSILVAAGSAAWVSANKRSYLYSVRR